MAIASPEFYDALLLEKMKMLIDLAMQRAKLKGSAKRISFEEFVVGLDTTERTTQRAVVCMMNETAIRKPSKKTPSGHHQQQQRQQQQHHQHQQQDRQTTASSPGSALAVDVVEMSGTPSSHRLREHFARENAILRMLGGASDDDDDDEDDDDGEQEQATDDDDFELNDDDEMAHVLRADDFRSQSIAARSDLRLRSRPAVDLATFSHVSAPSSTTLHLPTSRTDPPASSTGPSIVLESACPVIGRGTTTSASIAEASVSARRRISPLPIRYSALSQRELQLQPRQFSAIDPRHLTQLAMVLMGDPSASHSSDPAATSRQTRSDSFGQW